MNDPIPSESPRRARRLLRSPLLWAPLLALLALSSWVLASPVGASPDDDYHLTSIWCADVLPPVDCAAAGDGERVAPEGVVEAAHCYRWDPEISAVCQGNPGEETPDTETTRGNFNGGYPPLYYSFMSLFVGPDVTVSALGMRMINVVITIGLVSALFLLLPPRRRPALLWAWALSVVPLGLFLIASNNPSAWALAGIGTLWIAVLGYFESEGRRRVGFAVIAGIATLLAAGARGDSAAYAIVSLGIGALLAFERSRGFLLRSIYPLVLAVVSLLFLLSARQVASGVDGFTGVGRSDGQVAQIDAAALWISNLLNLPSLWAGFFGGSYGLGWLDTQMPAFVTFAGILVFVGVGFAGLRDAWPRKLLVVAGLVAILYLLPVWVLGRGLYPVGEQVQPRYLLPLLLVLAGVLLMSRDGGSVRPSRVQAWVAVAALSIANALALHATMRRFTTGIDNRGLNLDTNVEWWWEIGPSPMFVLVVGSASFAALLVLLVRASALRLESDSPIR